MSTPRRMRIRRLDEFSLVDKPANPLATIVLTKRAPEKEMPAPQDETITLSMLNKVLRVLGVGGIEPIEKRVKQLPDGKWMAMDDAGKEMGMFDTEAEARRAAYGEKKKMADPIKEPDTVSKADVEALTKRMEEIQKAADERIAKAEADAKANAEKVEKMQEDARVAGFVKRAAEFRSLPIKAAEFGPLMAKIAKALDEKEFAEFERVLSAANEVARVGGVLKEIGSGAAPEGSAEAEVNAQIAELRKQDPKLSVQAARGQVFKNDPTLRRKVEAEQAPAGR